jgi:RNA polymerase sigma-70 factor (ECF subfamily)
VQKDDPLLALLTRIKTGEEAAMELLYNLTVNRLYGLAVKIVTKPELAEEVIGDVFLQVWKKAGDFDSEKATPLAWLLMICRSRSLDTLRREKSATKNQYTDNTNKPIEEPVTETPLEVFEERECSDHMLAALNILNDKQRQTIALAFYKGMSHREISRYTGEPLGTVKSNLRRAQDILRKALTHEDAIKGVVYGKS